MTYIEEAQTRLKEALAVFSTDGELDKELLDLYTLLMLTKGSRTTLKDVHDAWAIWRQTTKPSHDSLIPFEELSNQVQELDRPFVKAIHLASDFLKTKP